jgi:ankyrin repeat protein
VELLLTRKEIDPDCADEDGRTPLSRAAGENYEQVVAILIEQARLIPESKDAAGRTPLSWAMNCFVQGPFQRVTYQDCGVVKLLLNQSQDTVDPNSRDQEGRTPLSWAIEYLPCIRDKLPSEFGLLLNRSGDSLAYKDCHGRTLFSRAAETGKIMMTEQLLKHGINPDLGDDDGRTPLSQTAGQGHNAMLDLLLGQDNVDPDSKDNVGRTPLWWAAKYGHASVVQSLLQKKAVNPESMDKNGHTPLLCAIDDKHTAITRLLIKRDRVTLHKLAQNGTIASLRSLLESGNDVNVNIKDNYGRTPLHTAASSGYVNIAEELIHRKADINCEDANGNTPLRVALEKEQQDIVQLLLQHSAQTEGIMSAEWLRVYNEGASDVVLELSQMSCGRKSVQMVEARRVKMSTETGLTRRLS